TQLSGAVGGSRSSRARSSGSAVVRTVRRSQEVGEITRMESMPPLRPPRRRHQHRSAGAVSAVSGASRLANVRPVSRCAVGECRMGWLTRAVAAAALLSVTAACGSVPEGAVPNVSGAAADTGGGTAPPAAGGAAGAEPVPEDCATSAEFPKRQLRGVWIATVRNIDWPSEPGLSADEQRDELVAQLDRAAELGLNAVFFHVRPTADA